MFPTEPLFWYGFHAPENRPFLALWSGQVLSQVADKVFYILLICAIGQILRHCGHGKFHALNADAGLYAASDLFSAVGGIFVDRFGKKSADGLESGSRLTDVSYPLAAKEFLILLVHL